MTIKEQALKWWDDLELSQAIQIQKDAGIYGHDMLITESEIIVFYVQNLRKSGKVFLNVS